MKIKLSLVGPLREYIDDESYRYIEVVVGSNIIDILNSMGIKVRRVMVIANGEKTTMWYVPKNLDNIKIIPVVTGG